MSPSRTTTAPLAKTIRTLALVWIASRLAMAAVAVVVASRTGRSFADLVANWDVQHFLSIARDGYVKPTDPAFFPGWPWLLGRLGDAGVPMEPGGVVLSCVLSVAAAAALWRLGGPRLGPWAAGLWLVAPTAIFTVVPYTESLFCALAFWAWERAKASQWWAMALLTAAACTVRVSGMFLIGALVILILTRPREGKGRSRRLPSMWPLAWLILPVVALLLYVDFHYQRTGDLMAWYHAQTSGWARALPEGQPLWRSLVLAPWQSFLNTVNAVLPGAYADHPGWVWIFRGEMISMAVGMISTVVLLLRRRWAEASWIAVQVYAFSLSYWWMSVNRAVLLWFPFWLLLAEFCAWQPTGDGARRAHRIVVVLGLAVSVAVMLVWSGFFYLGMWSS